MLSICIPIYNIDVRCLVNELQEQISSFKNEIIEIILIDDASNEDFKSLNRQLKHSTTYIELDKNIGRSKIRNLFLSYTTQPYLLFLDCDGLIKHNNLFINSYLKAINNNLNVVCGTRVYSEICPSKEYSLNWKYGKKIESPAITRSFMSNNFLIKKCIFESILFDEDITGYGQEDTFFGIKLAKKNININIINNPIFNNHLETNKTYLTKNISSIKNLIHLINSKKINNEDFHYIKLLKIYLLIDKLKLIPLYFFLYKIFKNRIYSNLLSSNPNLLFFNFYKLGEFLCIKKGLSNK